MYELKCTCPTTKLRIDELTKCSFCFRRFIHSFYDRAYRGPPELLAIRRPERG